jgi:hypothetical protein
MKTLTGASGSAGDFVRTMEQSLHS